MSWTQRSTEREDVIAEALAEASMNRSVRIRFATDVDAAQAQPTVTARGRAMGLDIDAMDTRLCRCVGPSADLAEFYGHVYHMPGLPPGY